MTKKNFFIITGGPGGGKTTLLESLAAKGYRFVPETARQIIKERVSKGLSPRPDAVTFAREIFENDLSKYIANAHLTSPLFFDRSMLDSACMLYDADPNEYNQIKGVCKKNQYSNRVFLTPPWKEIYQNDPERDQSFEESIVVYDRLEKWYGAHGYQPISLPRDSVEKRIQFILDHVF